MILVLPLPTAYIVAMAAWLVALALAFVGLLRLHRVGRRRRPLLLVVRVGLSTWMALACITGLELGFAAFYAESDALNFTNVARRWYDIHIAPQVVAGLRTRHSLAEMQRPGRERIAFVGDSFTFGHGVPRMEDRFSDRVEAALEMASPGSFATDNFGVPGYDVAAVAAQVTALFEGGYRPRLVVYVWQINDLEQLDTRTWSTAGRMSAARSDCWLIRDTWFLNWCYYRLFLGSRVVSTYFDDLRAGYDGAAFDRATEVLEKLRQTCAAHGAELRLVVFPFVHDLGPAYSFREAHRRLLGYAAKVGVRALDLEPILSPHVAEGLVVNPRDSHPNERAHGLVAEAMTRTLFDDLLARR